MSSSDIIDQEKDAMDSVVRDESIPDPIETEATKQELDTGHRILTEIIRQNKSACIPFMEEVDAEALGLWDYHIKIKTPMWINKMVEKFISNEYKSITEFAKDFRLMVENCYRYNSTDHIISKKAKRIEIAFESKLALLKKDIRDKTQLSVTSEGKFSLDMTNDDKNLVPVSRYGRIGNTREYASTLDDSSAKLVFDFVRCEETMLHEDEKKASYRERRQQEFLYQRIAAAWIATIESDTEIESIKTCAALPEVAFFLQLCETPLKFPELNMYQFERSLLVPKQSLYLSRIMTSLLCSYQERTHINNRFPMLFSTWNRRLKDKFAKWFELVQKYDSYSIAADKIGVDVRFFQTFDWKNPFVTNAAEAFSDLTLAQKSQTLKALCDSLFSLQSVQNALSALDGAQLQCMQLGKDYLGNCYIYFPQFCGDEVRVYRHREHGSPVPVDVPDEIWSPPKPEHPQEVENEVCVASADTQPEVSQEEAGDHRSNNMVNGISSETCVEEAVSGEKEANSLSVTSIESDEIPCNPTATDTEAHKHSNSEIVCEQPSPTVVTKLKNCKSDTLEKPDQEMAELIDKFQVEKRPQRVRKQTTRYTHELTSSPRKSRRALKNQVTDASSSPTSNKSKTKSRKSGAKKTVKEPVPKYGNVDFEMLCDSVDAIQILISDLEVQNTTENKQTYGRLAMDNHGELIDKLRWLYDELEPWHVKLQKARMTAQIKMKKEHDEIDNRVDRTDPWSEELTSKYPSYFGDILTSSHVDSPMSSIGSFDPDDEEYVHPYFTRKIIDKQYDEYLYEAERLSLLEPALEELETVLQSHMRELLKLADRDELQESNPVNDRRTRNKVKQQNKLLGKILQFAEEKCTCFPSLLPILVPNSDVFDTVDMVYLEEETRLQEIADELRRKRLERQKRKRPTSADKSQSEMPVKKFSQTLKYGQTNKRVDSSLAIQMKNGAIVPAARLDDGRVIPIQRFGDSSPAATMEELIENTHREVKSKSGGVVPTISLKPGQGYSNSNPHRQPYRTNSNVRAAVSNRNPTVIMPRLIVSENSSQTKATSQVTMPPPNHVNPATSVHSIVVNGTRYNIIPQNNVGSSRGNPTSSPVPLVLTQPTVVRPILTPVQIINPAIKYRPTVKHNKPSNVVLVPVQNCTTSGIGPVRMGSAPVMGIITSPQRQLQFQSADKTS